MNHAMYGRRGVTPMQARLAYSERRSTSGGPGSTPNVRILLCVILFSNFDSELESGARRPSQDSLTTRSSSYSAISVLPRHSSYGSLKSGTRSRMTGRSCMHLVKVFVLLQARQIALLLWTVLTVECVVMVKADTTWTMRTCILDHPHQIGGMAVAAPIITCRIRTKVMLSC